MNAVSVYNDLHEEESNNPVLNLTQSLENEGTDFVCQSVLDGALNDIDDTLSNSNDDNNNSSGLSTPVRGALLAIGGIGLLTALGISAYTRSEYMSERKKYKTSLADFNAKKSHLETLNQTLTTLLKKREEIISEEAQKLLTRQTNEIQQEVKDIEGQIQERKLELEQLLKNISDFELAQSNQEKLKRQIKETSLTRQEKRELFQKTLNELTERRTAFLGVQTYAEEMVKSGKTGVDGLLTYLDVTEIDTQLKAALAEKEALEETVKKPDQSVEQTVKDMEEIDQKIESSKKDLETYRSQITALETEIKGLNIEIDQGTRNLADLQIKYLSVIKNQLVSTFNTGGHLEKIEGDPPLTLEKSTTPKESGTYDVKYGTTFVGTYREAVRGETGTKRGFTIREDAFPKKGKKFIKTMSDLNGKNKTTLDFWSQFDKLYAITGDTSKITANTGKVIVKMDAVLRLDSVRNYEIKKQKRLKSEQKLQELRNDLIAKEAILKDFETKRLEIKNRKQVIEETQKLLVQEKTEARKKISELEIKIQDLNAERTDKSRKAKDFLEKFGKEIGGLTDSMDTKTQLETTYKRALSEAQSYEEQISKIRIQMNEELRLLDETQRKLEQEIAEIDTSKLPEGDQASLKENTKKLEELRKIKADQLSRINFASVRGELNPKNPSILDISSKIDAQRAQIQTVNDQKFDLKKPEFPSKFAGIAGILAVGGIATLLGGGLGLSDTPANNDLILEFIFNSEVEIRQGLSEIATINNNLLQRLTN